MYSTNAASRTLGVAFLIQFVTSMSSAVFQQTWLVPDNISETMLKIAAHPWLIRTSIFVDTLTALGVIFLGAALFVILRRHNEKMALTALGFYILEAALLAGSKMESFSLLHISQEYVAAGQPAYLLTMGNVALEAMSFVGTTLHVLAFCLGGVLFYFLLYQSKAVPRLLSLWGLVTIFPLLIGAVLKVFGHTLPFYVYVPYVPFELAIAIWILVKGLKTSDATSPA